MIIKAGTILSGNFAGYTIVVDDDTEGETGGFYLYIKGEVDSFDCWFDSLEQLGNQIVDFDVEWCVAC